MRLISNSAYFLKLFVLCAFVSSFGCATEGPLNTQLDPSWTVPNLSEYKKAIAKNTHQERKYDGFYNKFDISITKLTQDIRIKQLKLKANYSQWSKEKADREREKLIESMANETVFFVSSFTPKRDFNNLTMKDIGWAASLEVDGNRYPGTFKAFSQQPYKLENLYQHHTIWHRGFLLKFPVPSQTTDDKPQVITLTSPFGYAIYPYK